MTSASVLPADHGLNITAHGLVGEGRAGTVGRGWGVGVKWEVETQTFNPSLEIAWNVRGGEARWKTK